MEVGICLGWLLLAGGVGYWSTAKGHGFWMPWVISMAFSPIVGAIVVALYKPMTGTLEQREIQAGTMKRCASCAEMVRAEAVKCRFCGSNLGTTTTATVPVAQPIAPLGLAPVVALAPPPVPEVAVVAPEVSAHAEGPRDPPPLGQGFWLLFVGLGALIVAGALTAV